MCDLCRVQPTWIVAVVGDSAGSPVTVEVCKGCEVDVRDESHEVFKRHVARDILAPRFNRPRR